MSGRADSEKTDGKFLGLDLATNRWVRADHAKSPAPVDSRPPPIATQTPTSGWGGIRTPGGLSPSLVFKTSAFDHSATHPVPFRIAVRGFRVCQGCPNGSWGQPIDFHPRGSCRAEQRPRAQNGTPGLRKVQGDHAVVGRECEDSRSSLQGLHKVLLGRPAVFSPTAMPVGRSTGLIALPGGRVVAVSRRPRYTARQQLLATGIKAKIPNGYAPRAETENAHLMNGVGLRAWRCRATCRAPGHKTMVVARNGRAFPQDSNDAEYSASPLQGPRGFGSSLHADAYAAPGEVVHFSCENPPAASLRQYLPRGLPFVLEPQFLHPLLGGYAVGIPAHQVVVFVQHLIQGDGVALAGAGGHRFLQ